AATGRRYARVSGDFNPIHLWPATSKPLGFRRPIAHGMNLVSRAYAGLEAAASAGPHRLEVRFKTPAPLPGEVRCFYPPPGSAGERSFELWSADGERPHQVGRVESLDAQSA
ncbi:MAG: MaoC/PaaZ C-terminal domain-containing protein, partial [Acidobacteriota bacterium]